MHQSGTTESEKSLEFQGFYRGPRGLQVGTIRARKTLCAKFPRQIWIGWPLRYLVCKSDQNTLGPGAIMTRAVPVGSRISSDGIAHARVWAPRCRQVEVIVEGGKAVPLDAGGEWLLRRARRRAPREADISFDSVAVIDSIPIPRRVFSPRAARPVAGCRSAPFRWTDNDWPGVSRPGLVIYEMHIGTFTRPAPGKPHPSN